VTEDADLGLRLARAGYKIDTFDSSTQEEAPATLRGVFRQRVRWTKGWMQTALTHVRDPLRLVAELGVDGAAAAIALFVANIAGPLLGPPLAARLVCDAVFGDLLSPRDWPHICLSTLWCFLALSGAAALLAPLIAGLARRNLHAYWPALFLLPLWLAMTGLAALCAAYELWLRPFFWDKTEHGLCARGAVQAPLR
jgi:glycosyltransferase XagB